MPVDRQVAVSNPPAALIVAVVVAYLTIQTLSSARGPAPAAAPAAGTQPAAPRSHTTATANPGDSQT